MVRASALFVALLLASACASLRPYTPPQWRLLRSSMPIQRCVNTQPLDLRWWTQFDDPVLDSLIDADARRQSRHAGWPWLASNRRARSSTRPRSTGFHTCPYRRASIAASQAIPGFSESRRSHHDVSGRLRRLWEIDLFGRLRSAVRAASASAEAFEADLDDVRVSVVAEVARNYFELRGLQQQYAVAERSLTNQQETLRLTRVRRDTGIGEEQDVASAAARVAAIEAVLPPLQAALAQRSHRLAVLAGERPGHLRADLSPRVYPPLAKAISIGEAGGAAYATA